MELPGFFWRLGKTSRPPFPPWGVPVGCQEPPFAALAFSSIPVILQCKAGKPNYPHNFVAGAEIPISGLWLQSQAMAEGNKWNMALLLTLVTEQMFPVSCYWENASASHLPFSLPPEGTWETQKWQFARSTLPLITLPIISPRCMSCTSGPSLYLQNKTALQGRHYRRRTGRNQNRVWTSVRQLGRWEVFGLVPQLPVRRGRS